jgi:ATP synthase protein I
MAVGAVLVALGALVDGAPAALGAGIGIGMVLTFFGLGAVAIDLVAGIAPTLSLLVALLTYTLQVVLVGLVFVGLSRSGLLDAEIDADWLGGAVIAGTLTWLGAQLVTTLRARQPVYDLPATGTTAHTTGHTATDTSEQPGSEGSGGRSQAKEAAAR